MPEKTVNTMRQGRRRRRSRVPQEIEVQRFSPRSSLRCAHTRVVELPAVSSTAPAYVSRPFLSHVRSEYGSERAPHRERPRSRRRALRPPARSRPRLDAPTLRRGGPPPFPQRGPLRPSRCEPRASGRTAPSKPVRVDMSAASGARIPSASLAPMGRDPGSLAPSRTTGAHLRTGAVSYRSVRHARVPRGARFPIQPNEGSTMIWFLPRSDPGAATESLRPDGWGVSTHQGRLPYGRLARVLLLWMCAELARTGQARLDLVYALSDHGAEGGDRSCP